MSSRVYIAVIGDLVASRGLPPPVRRRIQSEFAAYFGSFPVTGAKGLAARPLLTLGDEFQVLFRADGDGAQAALDLIRTLVETARPASVRFGLGIGGLSTPRREQALGMDGPCFHRARAALERARKFGMLCQLERGGRAAESTWSLLAAYVLHQRTDWSEPQREAIVLFEELGTWKDVAERLGISRSAVTQRHQGAGWPLYRRAWEALSAGLDEIVSGGGTT